VIFGATTALLGSSFFANVAAGFLSGGVAGQYARLTGLALSGQMSQVGKVLFQPQDMILDAVLGGAIAGVSYGVARIPQYLHSQSTAPDPIVELPIRTGSSDKTSGILIVGENKIPLESVWIGPASKMPPGSAGFDIVTRTHVEGHASALMQQNQWTSGTLYINNPPCTSCTKLLPRMLPPSSNLRVIGPNGYENIFRGLIP
jgi:Double-stranded DNA deaminase toxin A